MSNLSNTFSRCNHFVRWLLNYSAWINVQFVCGGWEIGERVRLVLCVCVDYGLNFDQFFVRLMTFVRLLLTIQLETIVILFVNARYKWISTKAMRWLSIQQKQVQINRCQNHLVINIHKFTCSKHVFVNMKIDDDQK